MTNEEYMLNGLKFDNLEIREEQRKFNFNLGAFVAAWVALEVIPVTTLGVFLALIIAIVGMIYGLKVFIIFMKLDFLFMGQFIRDANNIGKWIVNRFRK